jgi:DNA-binding CsgD family transcriptional regulator
MNAQMTEFPEELDDEVVEEKEQWLLKKLKLKHLQICALLAQGMQNKKVAAAVGVTPEYITMLLRQPLIKEEIMRLSEVAGVRLEGMFTQVVEVIGDALTNGTHSEKLKAGRLHGELTKRIGRYDPVGVGTTDGEERLNRLADRLEFLTKSKVPGVYDENGQVVEEAVIVRERTFSGSDQASQENGNATQGN